MGIIAQLNALHVSTKEILVDAGFCTLSNLSGRIEAGLDIITRIPSNYKLHKFAVDMVGDNNLDQPQNAVRYGTRILHVCKVETTHDGHPIYLYVVLDKQEQASQAGRLQKSVDGLSMDPRELSEKVREMGRFVMLSTRDLPSSEVVPYYYKRQEIEQMFDVSWRFQTSGTPYSIIFVTPQRNGSRRQVPSNSIINGPFSGPIPQRRYS